MEDKITKAEIRDFHPESVYGDDWIDYLAQIKNAKTQDELLDVLFNIFEKHSVSIGDTAFIFSKILFSETTFQEILWMRDIAVVSGLYKNLKKSNQGDKS